MAKVRFLFATDLHGSETVWRKFLNSAKYFNLDALVLSGDMTGKLIVPLVKREDGKYDASLFGESHILTEADVPAFEEKVRKVSYIPYKTTPEEAEEIQSNEEKREKLFEGLQVQIIKLWLQLIPDRVPQSCKVILSPGNDDVFAIDDVIRNSPYSNVIFGEEEVVCLDEEHEVACCGWTNPTPWHTARECSEEELLERLEKVVAQIKNLKTAVFCFHCPPYNSIIDNAPKLTEDLKPVYASGSPVIIPVGSVSVRKVIEKYQPLICLHGHIHESAGFVKIGKTLCLNPGSEYGEGIMRAYLVEIEGNKVKRLQKVEA
ncbi:metallophosphoesterase [Candidatus Bathyarchaeota archaeon]|nr:metallophosphoesterase [Candidatus Bathyarchaeota archaeon]